MSAAPAAHTDLTTLFRSLFTAEELKRFLAGGPEGEDLVDLLPGRGTDLVSLAHEATSTLLRLGLVNAELFERLLAERPARHDEIVRVRDFFLTPDGHRTNAAVEARRYSARPAQGAGRTLALVCGALAIGAVVLGGLFAGARADAKQAREELATLRTQRGELEQELARVRSAIHMRAEPVIEGAILLKRRLEAHPVESPVLTGLMDGLVLGRWGEGNNLMRCIYGLDPAEPGFGVLGTRQIIWLDITYPRAEDGDNPVAKGLVVDVQEYSGVPVQPARGSLDAQGSLSERLSEPGWSMNSYRFGDLAPGEHALVALAHTVGPRSWAGVIGLPIAVRWTNPARGGAEEVLSIDTAQFAARLDRDLRLALIGNLGNSCPVR